MHFAGLHPAALDDDALLAQCEFSAVRRSGPGGQHRNKTSTGAVLVHRPTDVLAEANERRSQADNRRVALFRLRIRLALAVRRAPAEAAATEFAAPSALWRSRLRGEQLAVSAEHADFPALLAEALDVLAACDFDAPSAAAEIATTASQLVKLLRKEPEALRLVNAGRKERGLRPLR